jgi:hypothetical protein
MSLHDISKNDPMRSLPKPNTNDNVTNRLAHGTTQNHNAGEQAIGDGLKFKERQILARQSGTNKAVYGFLESTNEFGLKVAKPGIDVLTAEDIDLIFDSENNVFKVLDTGIIVTSGNSVPGVANGFSDSHVLTFGDPFSVSLDEAPAIIGFINLGGPSVWSALPETYFNGNGIGGAGGTASWVTHRIYAIVDQPYVITDYMTWNTGPATWPSETIRWYIFSQTNAI